MDSYGLYTAAYLSSLEQLENLIMSAVLIVSVRAIKLASADFLLESLQLKAWLLWAFLKDLKQSSEEVAWRKWPGEPEA